MGPDHPPPTGRGALVMSLVTAAVLAVVGIRPGAAAPRDADEDGVPDARDRCSDTAREDRGDVAADGCPSPLVVITETHVRPRTKVRYRGAEAALEPDTGFVIDAVADALRDSSSRVEVGVHTRAIGAEDFNLRLTRQRAELVRDALIARGIEGRRLTAVGYGSSRPANPCCNADESDGPSANTCPDPTVNRRTEFRILP